MGITSVPCRIAEMQDFKGTSYSLLIRCLFRVGKEAVEALISISENGSTFRGTLVFSLNSTTKIVVFYSFKQLYISQFCKLLIEL